MPSLRDGSRTGSSGSKAAKKNGVVLRVFIALLLAVIFFASGGGQAGTAPNLLDFNGGPVLGNPEIHNVYMDGSWDAHNPAAISLEKIDAFTSSLANSSYFNSASQYSVGSASFTGSDQASIFCPTPIIGGVTDFFSINAWMECMTTPSPIPFGGTISGIPAPDSNTVYAVYVPSGTQINDVFVSSCGNFGAYHFFGSNLTWQGPFFFPVLLPQTFAFTIVPVDCAHLPSAISSLEVTPMDGISEIASHELIEAATDPVIVTGWIDNTVVGFVKNILTKGEAADICEFGVGEKSTVPVRLTNGLLVAPYWSNTDGACVPIVDTTPPVTAAVISPPPNGAGWNNSPVTVTFTSTDNEPHGTGVKDIQFTLSGAQNSSRTVNGSSASVTISNEGITTITFFATDNAGNQESPNTLTVRIDLTPPSITAPPNVTAGTGPGAAICGAVIPAAILGSATATDDSGIVTITVSGVPTGNVFPVGTTAVTYTATDVVNFTASATQQVTVVDTTPPVLSTPANVTVNATSPAGAVVNYTLPAATDNCPGVSVAGVPPSGSTFAIGTTTVTVTATDAAHNIATKTFTVTVIGAAGQTSSLIGLVNSLGLPHGTTNSLIAKLNAALAAMNAGNTATACSVLTAFINEVRAQTGKKITAAEAAQLIAAANQIKAVLGCP